MMEEKTDVIVVGTGVAGLFSALNLPRGMRVLLITKAEEESSDSFLAQGGICMLRGEEDYESYVQDTLRAGHYENRMESVDLMVRTSPEIIADLVRLGVEFERDGEDFAFTREGAHSKPRILFHKDITGQEITSKLLSAVRKQPNVEIRPYTTMTDLLVEDGICRGIEARGPHGERMQIRAQYTILATGGIGGRYPHSTNFPHLTGDALDLAARYGIRTEHLDYVQFHPTTLYSKEPGRRFLISESVRGEGALLYNHQGKRFVDELLPRDVVTKAIREEMAREGTEFVWLSMEPIPRETILHHFPNIYQHCLEQGYDVTREPIPVVPAQHYFMGGIWVDRDSRTSMERLFAVGETSCNGVHGANRLASNSLLESLVFAKRAAAAIAGACAQTRRN